MWYPWLMSVPRPYLSKLVLLALEADLGLEDEAA
jgi:hypothetical protein